VRKRSFRPMLKLALQHSKNTRARLPFPTPSELMWSAEAKLPPDAEACASALQKHPRAASIPYPVGAYVECGSEASARSEACASALQKHRARLPFPTPSELMWSAEAKLPPDLKLALQHSKNTARSFHSLPRRSLCGVRKRSFRPMLKLALQHSKNTRARLNLSHAVGEGLGVRAKNAPLFRTQ
jgi:hypothetical protein